MPIFPALVSLLDVTSSRLLLLLSTVLCCAVTPTAKSVRELGGIHRPPLHTAKNQAAGIMFTYQQMRSMSACMWVLDVSAGSWTNYYAAFGAILLLGIYSFYSD